MVRYFRLTIDAYPSLIEKKSKNTQVTINFAVFFACFTTLNYQLHDFMQSGKIFDA